jgi:hypothetical protein
MDTLIALLLLLNALLLFGILTAVKSGFNEVIRGLESLDDG